MGSLGTLTVNIQEDVTGVSATESIGSLEFSNIHTALQV